MLLSLSVLVKFSYFGNTGELRRDLFSIFSSGAKCSGDDDLLLDLKCILVAKCLNL